MDILLTGAYGFLGSIIKNFLIKQNNKVYTLGKNKNNNFVVDISSDYPVFDNITFDLVIHCAGKAHSVPKTEQERDVFYSVNTIGTKNLLKGLKVIPERFVLISTVAVYGLIKGTNVNEYTPLNAKDPYGHSKILAEELVAEWGRNNKVKVTILRLPLVIGEESLGNLKAMIDGIKGGYYFNVNYGKSRRSMVLASDIAENIVDFSKIGGTYNLTDGIHPSYKELSSFIAYKMNKREPINIPLYFAKILIIFYNMISIISPKKRHRIEVKKFMNDLTFDDSKARKKLNWKSSPVLQSNFLEFIDK